MCHINSAHCIKSLDYFPLQLEHTPSELIHHGPRRSLSQLLWPYCFSNMLGLLPAQGFTFRVLCLGNSLPQDIFWLVSFCYLGLCSNVTFSERISLTTPPKEPHTYSVSPLTPISTYSIFFIDLPLCKIKLFIYLLCCLLKKRMQAKWEQSGFCSRMYAGHPEYFLAYSNTQIYLLLPQLQALLSPIFVSCRCWNQLPQLSGLKKYNLCTYSSGGQSLKSKCQKNCVPSEGSRVESILLPFPTYSSYFHSLACGLFLASLKSLASVVTDSDPPASLANSPCDYIELTE